MDHAGGFGGDLQFFFAVQFLFFAERGIFERALAGGQSSAVAAVYAPLGLENVEILSDGYLGCKELFREVDYQDAALAIQYVEDLPAAFFVQHRAVWRSCFHVMSTVARAAGSPRPNVFYT
jgi:hypothetical protein